MSGEGCAIILELNIKLYKRPKENFLIKWFRNIQEISNSNSEYSSKEK
jgi:hypothetical protein